MIWFSQKTHAFSARWEHVAQQVRITPKVHSETSEESLLMKNYCESRIVLQILKIKKTPLKKKLALSKDSAVERWRNISSFVGKVPEKLTRIWILPWPVTDEWNLNKKGWWKVKRKNSDDRTFSSLIWVVLLALKEPSTDDSSFLWSPQRTQQLYFSLLFVLEFNSRLNSK